MESSQKKFKRTINPKRPSKQVKGDWPDKKVLKLINSVKHRPELWKIGSAAYKVPKPRVWQEVATELGNGDWMDCRAKWQNLRVSYKTNLSTLKKKSSDDIARIRWRFFDAMAFIGTDNQQSINSTSNLSLNHDDDNDDSQADAEDEPSNLSGLSASVKPDVDKCLIRHVPSPAEQMFDLVRHPDQHSAFGDHIAAELRSLPIKEANVLKCRLTRVLLNFWEESENEVKLEPPSFNPSPVQDYDESGQSVEL